MCIMELLCAPMLKTEIPQKLLNLTHTLCYYNLCIFYLAATQDRSQDKSVVCDTSSLDAARCQPVATSTTAKGPGVRCVQITHVSEPKGQG